MNPSIVLCSLILSSLCSPILSSLWATEPDLERVQHSERIEGFSPFESARIRSALQLAQLRLTKKERCAELFDELDDDGATLLSQAQFEGPSTVEARKICRRHVALFTTIGGRQIRVCSGAFQLERRTLASLLLHEAMHLGGQPEAPAVPDAPTSSELTRRVRKACSL